jgi:nitroimidazol reductase NimA-like FMN-containing flavoprotein (pyridoxamine 5'-phosphate oxidase superfamily)
MWLYDEAHRSERFAAINARITPRVRVKRGAEKGRYDQAIIEAVLDRALVAHVSFATDDGVFCIPTLFARVGQMLYIHGSQASHMLRALRAGAACCVTVTVIDGLVLARSVFEHSANYESVVAYGRFTSVEGPSERLEALRAFTDKIIPGRWAEVRPPGEQELIQTEILRMPVTEASAKVRSGPPDDDDTPDAELDVWAGVIPLSTSFGVPVPSPGLRAGISLSESVKRLMNEARVESEDVASDEDD